MQTTVTWEEVQAHNQEINDNEGDSDSCWRTKIFTLSDDKVSGLSVDSYKPSVYSVFGNNGDNFWNIKVLKSMLFFLCTLITLIMFVYFAFIILNDIYNYLFIDPFLYTPDRDTQRERETENQNQNQNDNENENENENETSKKKNNNEQQSRLRPQLQRTRSVGGHTRVTFLLFGRKIKCFDQCIVCSWWLKDIFSSYIEPWWLDHFDIDKKGWCLLIIAREWLETIIECNALFSYNGVFLLNDIWQYMISGDSYNPDYVARGYKAEFIITFAVVVFLNNINVGILWLFYVQVRPFYCAGSFFRNLITLSDALYDLFYATFPLILVAASTDNSDFLTSAGALQTNSGYVYYSLSYICTFCFFFYVCVSIMHYCCFSALRCLILLPFFATFFCCCVFLNISS